MSKISQKILTLLLVIAMVFGVSATTIAAATDGGYTAGAGTESGNKGDAVKPETDEEDSDSGSITKGWCNIEYDGNNITVIIAPDKEAILGTKADDIKELATFIVEAVKKVVVDDMLADVLPDGLGSEIDPDTIWFDALDGYLGKLYGEDVDNKYVEFLKDAINDEQVLVDFAKHVCALLKAGVLSGMVKLEELPAKDGIEEYITDMLNDYVDAYVDDYVIKAVDDYISYCLGESAGDSDVIAFAEEYLISYTREALENYIKTLKGEPVSSNDFQAQIEEFAADYIKDYVKDAVAEYVQAKVEGNEVPSSVVNNYIEEFITEEIERRVDTYITNKLANVEPTDEIDRLVDEYAGDYINEYIEDAVFDYIDARVNGTAIPDNEVNTYIESFVNNEIEKRINTFIENKAAGKDPVDEVDKLVADYANEYINGYVADAVAEYIKAKRGGAELPEDEIYDYVESFVNDEIKKRVDAYITNKLADAETTDEVDKLIAEYADKYIADYVNTAVEKYIKAKADGNTLSDKEIYKYIDSFINDEIGKRVEQYLADKVAGKDPVDEVDKFVADYADEYVKNYVSEAVTDYIGAKVNGETLSGDEFYEYIDEFITEEINSRVEKYLNNKAEDIVSDDAVDKLVAKYADDYVNTYVEDAFEKYINAKFDGAAIDPTLEALIDAEFDAYCVDYYDDQIAAYKAYKQNGGEKPELYDVIEKNVRDAVAQKLVEEGIFDNLDDAKKAYDENSGEIDIFEYLDDINFADYKEEAIASLGKDDYREAFATVEVEELIKKVLGKDDLKASIKADISVDKVLASIGSENAATIIDTVNIDTVIADAIADAGVQATIKAELKIDDILSDMEDADIQAIIDTIDINEVLEDALADEKIQATIKAEIMVDDILASVDEADVQKLVDGVDLDAILADAFNNENVKATIKSEIQVDEILVYIGEENIQKLIDTVDIDEVLLDALEDEKVQKLIKDEIDIDEVLKHIGAENVQKLIDTVDIDEILEKVDDAKLAEIVDNMYKEYTDDKVVEMICDIIKEFKTNNPDKLDKLVAEVKAQVKNKIATGELDEKFEELFGVKITEMLAEIDVVATIVGGHYADTVTELEETPEGLQSYIALLDLVQDIKINDVSIYGNSENGKVFLRDNVEKLLLDIPTFEDLENMKDEEMFLSYVFAVVTDFGDCELNLTVKLVDGDGICDNCGEDVEKASDCKEHKDEFGGRVFDIIRKVAAIINRNVSYSFVQLDGEYDIVLDVNIPEELAKAILKACESGRISDKLKNEVFDKISYNGKEIYAFINENVSFEALIELLDKVNLDGILDSEYVSKFEKLDGLTAEEIEAKIREYENYYNKAISIMHKAYAKLPEKLTEKTIFDLYDDEAGNFHASYDFDVDLGDIAYKANEKLANYLEAFLDDLTVKGSIDATVTIENIHKVTYVINGEVVKQGFLPVGANVAFFSGITEVAGETIIDWVDGNGLSIATMPGADTVVYAVTKAASAVLNASATEIVYGEGNIVLTAIPHYNTQNPEITYTWYKDGVIVEGATEKTLALTDVAQSGAYYVVITVTDNYGTSELVTNVVNVTVKPIEIDIESAVEWDYKEPFTYDEKSHDVAAKVLEAYKDLVKFVGITSNSAIDADKYVATATFTLVDSSNYVFVNGNTVECAWEILPVEYSEADLAWGVTPEFVYEYGVTHTLAAPTAPKGLTVVITDNAATDAGNYVAKVTVTAAKNYKWVGDETVEQAWKIAPKALDLSAIEWKANGVDTDNDNSKFTFVYNGNAQGVYVDGLPADIASAIVYTDASAVAATGKTLTAKVAINYEGTKIATNYAISGEFATQDWEIVKSVITLNNLSWTGYTGLVYNGQNQMPTLVGLPSDSRVVVSYSYYIKSGDGFELVTEAKNAGTYKVVVAISAADTDNFTIATDIVKEIEYVINKAAVNVDAEWNYTTPFIYDGADKTVTLKPITNSFIKAIVYSENVYKNAGNYTAKATIALNDGLFANYDLVVNGKNVGESTDLVLDWAIAKKSITLPALSWTESSFKYDGEEKSIALDLSALSAELLEAINVTYAGVTKATEAGVYTATAAISLKDAANYEFTSNTKLNYEIEWAIAKFVIDLGALTWIKPLNDKLIYNGKEKTTPSLDLSKIDKGSLSLIKVEYKHFAADGTEVTELINAGKYATKAIITSVNPAMYAITFDGVDSCDWEIFKAEYNLSANGVSVNMNVVDGNVVAPDASGVVRVEYDGLEHTVTLGDCVLPAGLSKENVQYVNNTQTNVGTYSVIVTFVSENANYKNASMIFFFAITDEDKATDFKNDDVFIIVDQPLDSGYTVEVDNHKEQISNSVIAELAPSGKVAQFVVAYDINFYDENNELVHIFEKTQENNGVTGYNFIVTIDIPAHLANSGKTLMVVHLEENGDGFDMEIVDNARRIGNKMQFDVTHFSIYAIVEIGDKVPECLNHYDIDKDGFCDNPNCGIEMPAGPEQPDEPDCNHVDLDGDGKCEICGEQFKEPDTPDNPPTECEHEDADNDGKCDYCGEDVEKEPTDCEHEDSDNDGKCDNCGEQIGEPGTPDDPTPDEPDCEHKDNDNNGYCDICGNRVVISVPGKEYYFGTANGTVDIFVSTGAPDGITLSVTDVTGQNIAVDLSAILKAGYKAELKAAYDINFLDGANVTTLNGRFVVRLLIPEELRSGNRDLRIVHIASDATVTEIASNRSGNYLVFETDHFSVYSIVEVSTDGSVDPSPIGPDPVDPTLPDEDEGSLIWLWIIIIVLVVAVAAAAVFYILKRRNGGDGNDGPDEEIVAPAPKEPKVEEPKVEEPKVEEPKVEEPKVEELKVEEPKVEEPEVEEPVIEAVAAENAVPQNEAFIPSFTQMSEDDEGAGRRLVNGQIVPVRYRTSFMSRLIQSEPPIQDYYTVVKNTLLSYNGVKARTSWNFESFNKGRIQCAKLNVKGNAFQVYLGLDTNEYSAEKYHFIDVSDKPKLDKVPMMIKVKSERALKYSLELIEEVMKKNGIEQGEMPTDDYHLPFESTEALVDRDLVKIILPDGMIIDDNTVIERVNVGDFLKDVSDEVDDSKFIHVDAEVADTMMSDEEARTLIETATRSRKLKGTKFTEINIDTICANYENGETVDIDNLKDKSLIAKKADKVKVLARGVMTKRLTVVADKFSIQAVKMIGLAGGHAKKYED